MISMIIDPELHCLTMNGEPAWRVQARRQHEQRRNLRFPLGTA
jgi:hypothetical protein